jgi:glycopeptide antibiotics resistance protein
MIVRETALLWSAPILLAITAVLMVWQRASFGRTLTALVLAGFVVWVLTSAFFPLPIDSRLIGDMKTEHYLSNNFEPLRTIRRVFQVQGQPYFSALRQLAGNFILLIPLTVLGPVLWKRLRSWRLALLVGFSASLAIESLQLGISAVLGVTYRIFDVDDLLLNTVGAVVGYGAYAMISRLVTLVRKDRRRPGALPDPPGSVETPQP